MKFKKIFTLFFLLFFIYGCDQDMHKEKVVGEVKHIHEKILAKVNGIPITVSDFEKEKNNLPPHLKKLLKEKDKQQQFLDNLITKELLYQEAEKLKLENRENIKEILNSYKKDLLINELIRTQIKSKVQIKDDDAYKYYLKHKKQFYTAATYRFERYIFKDFTDAQNFLKTHDISQCFNICKKEKISKRLNEIIDPDISNIIESMTTGKYSDILWTKKGYSVLKLIKKTKGKLKPFYKVKNEIYKILKEKMEKELLSQYINILKSSANIVVYNGDNQTNQQ
jgi:hypothetical protein